MVNHRVNDYNERSNRQHSHAVFSIDDPRWGRGDGNGGTKNDQKRPQDPKRPGNGKDGEGPPDLDEMWREFNRRLAGLFGKKPGNGAPRADNGRGAKIGFGIVIGVLIAIYLGSGVFVVQDGHVGVVSQFGKYQVDGRRRASTGACRIRSSRTRSSIPSQIRSVEVGRNNALTQANVRDASLLTHDADIVDVRFAVQYQIKSPTDYLFRNLDPDAERDAGRRRPRSARSPARQPTDDLLYKDREALRARLIETIQRSLDAYKTGLQVTGVTVQSVQVPPQVQPAFEEAAKVRQDNERARDTAQAYADQLLPRAKADAASMIDEATAYSNRVVTQAQGDAERFKQVYAEYSKAPAVIRQRMYLDTMQQIYSRTTKVFVDSKAGNNVVYLPLDKLVEAQSPAGEGRGRRQPSRLRAAPRRGGGPQARAQRTARASAPAAAAPPAPASAAQRREPEPQRAIRCARAMRSARAAVKTTCNKEREHESNHCARRRRRHRAVHRLVDDLHRRRTACRRRLRAWRRQSATRQARACTSSCRRRSRRLTLIDTRTLTIDETGADRFTTSRQERSARQHGHQVSRGRSAQALRKQREEHADRAGALTALARTALASAFTKRSLTDALGDQQAIASEAQKSDRAAGAAFGVRTGRSAD